MDQPADIIAITGEHIILEGDTVEVEGMPELELQDDSPTDPYNTSTVRILNRHDFRC